MNENHLRSLLTQLHDRLGSANALDAEDRSLLLTVLGDIEKLLAKDEAATPPDTSRIESLAVKFEAGHPVLAESLRRVADALGKAGI